MEYAGKLCREIFVRFLLVSGKQVEMGEKKTPWEIQSCLKQLNERGLVYAQIFKINILKSFFLSIYVFLSKKLCEWNEDEIPKINQIKLFSNRFIIYKQPTKNNNFIQVITYLRWTTHKIRSHEFVSIPCYLMSPATVSLNPFSACPASSLYPAYCHFELLNSLNDIGRWSCHYSHTRTQSFYSERKRSSFAFVKNST